MSNQSNNTTALAQPVFVWGSLSTWIAQAAFIAAAVALPAIAHLAGLPVRWILPMHWPVLLAGLLYGWRGGVLVGVLSPATNWLITGFPLPLVLPAMTFELATYGIVTGWLREVKLWNGFSATAGGVIAGRLVFLATVWVTMGYEGSFAAYIPAAMLPGLIAGLAQIGVLGWIARFITELNRSVNIENRPF